MFAYSRKGLPHSLKHAAELVKTFGHHAGPCTHLGEIIHKVDIKEAAELARTYADRNKTTEEMTKYVQWRELFLAVQQLLNVPKDKDDIGVASDEGDDDSDREANQTVVKPTLRVLSLLQEDLHFCDDWHDMVPHDNGRPPPMWGATFLSKKVLLTRNELLTLLRTKLRMAQTWTNIVLLARTLQLKCFGSVILLSDNFKRKVVGTSSTSPDRRDFVRLKGIVDNTALSVQVMCFVEVSGLEIANIPVPEDLLEPPTNACNSDRIVFALVRWLSPDHRCLLRDSKFLPLCPPPFGSNHALWTFTKLRCQRGYLTDHMFARQLSLFKGSDRAAQRKHAKTLKYARYDLIQLHSIDKYMNCTTIENGQTILESVTLPF